MGVNFLEEIAQMLILGRMHEFFIETKKTQKYIGKTYIINVLQDISEKLTVSDFDLSIIFWKKRAPERFLRKILIHRNIIIRFLWIFFYKVMDP